MKLVYPACFYEDTDTGAYAVEVVDLQGCSTGAASLSEAIIMAEDAASGWVLSELEDGNRIPQATPLPDVVCGSGGFVSLLVLDMDEYTLKYGDKAVRKNLTIPAWLNTFAEEQGVNFSQVLQESLTQLYLTKV